MVQFLQKAIFFCFLISKLIVELEFLNKELGLDLVFIFLQPFTESFFLLLTFLPSLFLIIQVLVVIYVHICCYLGLMFVFISSV